MSIKDTIKWILLFCVTIGTVVMYQPDIYLSDGYGQIKALMMGALGCLFVMSFSLKDFTSSLFLRKLTLAIVVIALEFVLFFLFSMHMRWNDLIQLVLVLLFILIGMGMKNNRKALILLCTCFSIATLVLAIMSVNTFLSGFDLTDNPYLIEGKNQVGAIVAVGGGLAFFLSQHTNSKLRWMYLSLALAIFLMLLIIRCRTALVAYFFFVALYVLRYWSRKSKFFFFFIFILVSVIYADVIVDLLKAVFIENRDSVDLNTVSTGRLNRNLKGVDYFLSHVFTGELIEYSKINLIHNYILLRLVRYGIWGISFVYVYFLVLLVNIRCFSRKLSNIDLVGAYLLTIPLFCSLLEPGAPFGPGTIQLLPFLLFGMSIKREPQTC